MNEPAEVVKPADPDLLPAEQQQQVDHLANVLAGTEPLAPGDQQVVVESTSGGNYDDDAAMCVDMFAEMATAYCAEVGPLWPNDKRKKVSVALAAVFKKYDFSFAKFGPELALAAFAGPVLWQSSKIIAKKMNEQQAAPAAAANANN